MTTASDEYYRWLASHWDARTRLLVFPVRDGARSVRWDGKKAVMTQETSKEPVPLCAWDASGALVEEGLGPRYVAPKPCTPERLIAALRKLDGAPGVAPDCLVAVDGVVRSVSAYTTVALRQAVDSALADALRGATTLDAVHDSFATRWPRADEAAFAWRRYLEWLGACRDGRPGVAGEEEDGASLLVAWKRALAVPDQGARRRDRTDPEG